MQLKEEAMEDILEEARKYMKGKSPRVPTNYSVYESFKQRIRRLDLLPGTYERAVRRLADILRV